MNLASRKFAAFLAIIGLFAFISVLLFGISHTFGMEMKDDGTMSGCMFDGQAAICPMTFAEHISLWQSMLTVMPQKSLMFIALLALLLVVIFTTKNILAPPSLSSDKASTQKLYLAQHPDLPLFDPLKEAFSQGILNPKIYEFAIL